MKIFFFKFAQCHTTPDGNIFSDSPRKLVSTGGSKDYYFEIYSVHPQFPAKLDIVWTRVLEGSLRGLGFESCLKHGYLLILKALHSCDWSGLKLYEVPRNNE